MRKLILFMILLISLFLTACSSKQSQVNLEITEFDFGDVVNGDVVSKDVIVSNTGTADLIVETVTTTCGCTSASLDEMVIPVGGQSTLHIEFDSGAHGPDSEGQVMRQVILISNDPEQPEATVEFIANVVLPKTP